MKYLPIKFHVFYIAFTLLVSFYGPKIYQNYNKLPVFIFITVYLIIVYFGFKIGYNKNNVYPNNRFKPNIIKITQSSIVISLILLIINTLFLFSTGRLNLDISSIGANYSNFYDYYNEKKESGLFTFENIFLMVSAIPKFISLTLGFFYYNNFNRRVKILFISLISLILITQTLSLGNQKSIGDIVIFASLTLLIKSTSFSKEKRNRLLKRIGIIFSLLFVILSYTQFSRLSSRDISYKELNDKMASYSQFDFEHPVFKVFGYKFGLGIATFTTGYLSNGYYGLSKTLEMDYEWSYGVGSSVALTSIIEKASGEDVYKKTYLDRMEKEYNIPGKKHWHTIFPWFASDFTFVGTLIIFYFFAYYYGKSWREVIENKNPVSFLLFSLLTIMFIFVPSNNQIFHGFDYLFITLFVFWFWSKFHNRFNFSVN